MVYMESLLLILLDSGYKGIHFYEISIKLLQDE